MFDSCKFFICGCFSFFLCFLARRETRVCTTMRFGLPGSAVTRNTSEMHFPTLLFRVYIRVQLRSERSKSAALPFHVRIEPTPEPEYPRLQSLEFAKSTWQFFSRKLRYTCECL